MKRDKSINILAIETSCDETAAAVIGVDGDQPIILSNVVSSQIDLHAKTGGVVPEVASRAHMEAIIPVIEEALGNAISNNKLSNDQIPELKIGILLKDITHIAVTAGPGLIGSLLVGFNTAKSLAYALNLPIIPINHIEGHIYSALAQGRISGDLEANSKPINFPVLALTVSGGHSSLTLMRNHGVYENIGSTLDDAAGEAFDKVAKLLNLGYPGGPSVSKIAAEFRASGKHTGLTLPLPLAHDASCNFSFSGLKTSALNALRKAEKEYQNDPEKLEDFKDELAMVFEDTAVAHLIDKTAKAIEATSAKHLILAGGVAANGYLRQKLSELADKQGISLTIPPFEYCGDNAAMIGLAAYHHILRRDVSTWDKVKVDSNYKL